MTQRKEARILAEKLGIHEEAARGRIRRAQQYGMDYHLIEESRDKKCEICKKKPRTQLVLDHSHSHNGRRGWICSACNIGLGMFKDDPVALRAAADYLERSARVVF